MLGRITFSGKKQTKRLLSESTNSSRTYNPINTKGSVNQKLLNTIYPGFGPEE